jgi:hypothetical protein
MQGLVGKHRLSADFDVGGSSYILSWTRASGTLANRPIVDEFQSALT